MRDNATCPNVFQNLATVSDVGNEPENAHLHATDGAQQL